MNCEDFFPITSNVVPCCAVCSRTLDCAKDLYACLTPEEREQYIYRLRELRKESAGPVLEHRAGEMEQESNELNYSDASLTEEREERQG